MTSRGGVDTQRGPTEHKRERERKKEVFFKPPSSFSLLLLRSFSFSFSSVGVSSGDDQAPAAS
jgi:hypothetical protein